MKQINTARFYVYINGDWIKITLREGERVSHVEGGPTEEGYSYTAREWFLEEGLLYLQVTQRSRDCDGRYEQYDDYCCPISNVGFCRSPENSLIGYPRWEELHSRQRDYAAEAMGY